MRKSTNFLTLGRQSCSKIVIGLVLALASFGTVPAALAQVDQGKTRDQATIASTRIPDVAADTASPVYVIDRTQIEASGVAILGDLLQQLPMIAGGVLNPQVNNGGGTGETTVGLRGLGSRRTLVLLNGRRINTASTPADVNAIPINIVERIEVSLDGGSVTYGSDAVAGVVNIITRSNFEGVEAVTSQGQSSRGDGDRTYQNVTLGSVTPTRRLLAGMNFDRRSPVAAADRTFSRSVSALLFGQDVQSGSSAIPEGSFAVRRANAAAAGITCPGSGTNVLLRRVEGADGSHFDSANWRCANFSLGPGTDLYNFQPPNVDMTPQERFGAFLMGDLAVTRGVELFAESSFHHTRASSELAPNPVSGSSENLIISARNIYNPFGQDIFDSRVRMVPLGPRRGMAATDRFRATTGLRGRFSDRYAWEAYATFAESREVDEFHGELFKDGLRDALGPSFRDSSGTPRCGTPEAPITNCTPINYFSLPNDPQSVALLGALASNERDLTMSSMRTYSAHLSGPVGRLPAGVPTFTIGLERRDESVDERPDLLYLTERLTGGSRQRLKGNVSVNELYGEIVAPVLRGVPGVPRLQIEAGARYSDHSASGGTPLGKIGFTWRPAADLSVRGSFEQVFSTPTIVDLFTSPLPTGFVFFIDPCQREVTPVGVNPNIDRACAGVPRNGSFVQSTFFADSTFSGNPNLRAQTGAVTSWGAIYNPRFYRPLTAEVTIWNVDLNGTVDQPTAQQRLNQCYLHGRFCDSFRRDPLSQQVTDVTNPLENLGRFETRGIDLGIRLQSLRTRVGAMTYLFQATYLIRSEQEIIAGDPETRVVNVGRLDSGNYARWRAQSNLQWTSGPVQAAFRTQYISDALENPNDLGVNPSAGDCAPGMMVAPSGAVCLRKIGAYFRSDVSGTWTVAALHLDLSAGVDNLFDRQPPRVYSAFQNNTDVETYDTVGRSYWARMKVRF